MIEYPHIQNRLRIWAGNIIAVPGNEPISTVTHVSNYQYNPYVTTLLNCDYCSHVYISVKKALEVIPGSYVTIVSNRYMRYFVLPSGPPPDYKCPCDFVNDWYKIMRDNADIPESVGSQAVSREIKEQECEMFSLLAPC